MTNHFITLFDANHKRTTIILFTLAFILIVIALSIGTSDNFPAIAMLIAGIIILFFSLLHPWKKAIYYATLVAVCGIILPLIWGNQLLGESLDVLIGGICATGILVGISGIIIRSFINFRNHDN
jgi:hypothetical protein